MVGPLWNYGILLFLCLEPRPVDVDAKTNQKSQKKIFVIQNIDSVPSNVQSSRQEALLYVFEDNEAVIRTTMKERSPRMRHVSRTHRIELDWFDRIKLDSKIQITCIDTKNQLANILTKGNFTRDEWNHLLCLFTISHFSSTDNKIHKKSPNKIETYDESYCQEAVVRIVLVFSEPGKRRYGSQSPWRSIEGGDRSGRPDKGTEFCEASDQHYHEQFMEKLLFNKLFKIG